MSCAHYVLCSLCPVLTVSCAHYVLCPLCPVLTVSRACSMCPVLTVSCDQCPVITVSCDHCVLCSLSPVAMCVLHTVTGAHMSQHVPTLPKGPITEVALDASNLLVHCGDVALETSSAAVTLVTQITLYQPI